MDVVGLKELEAQKRREDNTRYEETPGANGESFMHDDESSRSRRTPKELQGRRKWNEPPVDSMTDEAPLAVWARPASKKTYAEIEETFADWQRRQAEEAARPALPIAP